jgi:hypothetical protein
MIKRIWLLDAAPSVGLTDAISAPGPARPVRVTIASVLRELTPQAPYDTVALAWFRDAEHLERFDNGYNDAAACAATLAATEQIKRGGDWLAGHWDRGGSAFKHIALARRADGLSREEFSARWSAHAGRVGATPIPEPVQGVAYVQNHPLVTERSGEPPYDAVNEVYFTDLDGLRTRVRWFADNATDSSTDSAADGDALFGENAFLAVREELLTT